MQQIKVYISAKLEHSRKLVGCAPDGFHSNARWIHMAEAGRTKLKPVSHWQQENFDDIEMAHVFVLYVEPQDVLCGSLVELGHAIRAGKKIWIAGNGHGVEVKPESQDNYITVPHAGVLPWGLYTQSIRMAMGLPEAFLAIKRHFRPETILGHDGEKS